MENENTVSTCPNKPTKSFIHYFNKLFGFTKKPGNASMSNTIDMVYTNVLCSSASEKTLTENDSLSPEESYEKIIATENMPLDAYLLLPVNVESRYGGQNLSPDQLPQFCNQLNHLLEILRNIQADAKVMGEYPRKLQAELEREAGELQLIYTEVKSVQDSINSFKFQKDLIKTEKVEVLDNLKRLEEEELREIEKSINGKDTPLLKQWERTKRSKIPEAYDRLLEDVYRSQAMLRNLETLIKHKKKSLSNNKDDKKACAVFGTTHAYNRRIPLSGIPLRTHLTALKEN